MDLNYSWFILLGVLLTGLRDPRRLRPRRRHPASRGAEGRGAAHPDELHRAAVGRQRGLAGHVRRRAVRRVSARVRDGVLGLLHGVHGAAVCADLPRGVDGVSQQARRAGVARVLGRVVLRRQRAGHVPVRRGGGQRDAGHAASAPTWSFTGRSVDLLHPYALLVGLFAVATFAMHGSIYLYLKTEGELQQRIRAWMWRTFGDLPRAVSVHHDLHAGGRAAGDAQLPRFIRGRGSSWC